VRAALALLDALPAGRPRIAVLGTMRELGTHEASLHDAVARDALATGIERIVATGAFADAFARVAPDAPHVTRVADASDAWPALEALLAPGAVVLLKGSRGVRLERLLPDLSAWAAA
jgi:UDP-N-acetylmuramoyl-tripeptide--D-alanyl-D-alanine ligase